MSLGKYEHDRAFTNAFFPNIASCGDLTKYFCLSFYSDIHIWPDVPELTLTSGADLTLKCTGDVPVKWNQNQYDPTLLIEKVRIIE